MDERFPFRWGHKGGARLLSVVLVDFFGAEALFNFEEGLSDVLGHVFQVCVVELGLLLGEKAGLL